MPLTFKKVVIIIIIIIFNLMLDLVRCYYCHKELDGWEPKDVPWDEHKRGDCPYIKKGKKPLDLTGDDVFELEAERYCAILVRTLPSMYSWDLNTHFIKLTQV